ncbi:MAG: hypothetical protein KAQ81_14695 [Deltaproteobacteria bacterium]|nr:hypothetical protein [Deltaproteobacteria bacterium]
MIFYVVVDIVTYICLKMGITKPLYWVALSALIKTYSLPTIPIRIHFAKLQQSLYTTACSSGNNNKVFQWIVDIKGERELFNLAVAFIV